MGQLFVEVLMTARSVQNCASPNLISHLYHMIAPGDTPEAGAQKAGKTEVQMNKGFNFHVLNTTGGRVMGTLREDLGKR